MYQQPLNIQTPAMLYLSGQQTHRAVPDFIVDISPQAWSAYEQSRASGALEAMAAPGRIECETCNSRTYQDVSDDSSVSFQTPTHIHPSQSAAMVSAHEGEHVANEQHRADQEGREIISQTVILHSAICPECRRAYIAGGETRTTSRQAAEPDGHEHGHADEDSGAHPA